MTEDWKKRILESTHEAAMDYVDGFRLKEERILNMVERGELTVDEMADAFAYYLRSYLETIKETRDKE